VLTVQPTCEESSTALCCKSRWTGVTRWVFSSAVWPPAWPRSGHARPLNAATPEERELKLLEWEEFTQKHYRRMTEEERAETHRATRATRQAPP
jgi:hypothetical protein